MALKRKITKAEFEALSDGLKTEYKADGDNYVLDLDDTGFENLKAEKAEERRKREEAERKLQEREQADAEAAEKLRKEQEKAAKAAGDVEALEKSWKTKYEADLAAERARAEAAANALETIFVDNVARQMANKISTVPDLLVDLIKKRLRVEHAGETPITRVVDAAGKPSALSLADLEKEFVDNKSFAAIIKASDAQGGGAGAGSDGNGVPRKKLSEMTATEEAKFANEHPDEYARLVASQT
jgi:hypothetical protein